MRQIAAVLPLLTFGGLIAGACSSIPDAPYRPSQVDVVASVSTDGQGVLHYEFADGRAEAIDPRGMRFLNSGAQEGDLMLRGETYGQAWAYSVLRAGDWWLLDGGGGEVRNGRLATSQKLSLAFATGFDIEANGGPRWVSDRGHSFCLNENGEVVSVSRG